MIKNIKLQIWDTAGQERFKTITTSYYRGAHGIVVVYDVTNRESFDNIDNFMKEVHDNASENVHVFLCGNMIDKSSERVISTEEGYSAAAKYNAGFIEVSAKEGTNISELSWIKLIENNKKI